MDGSTMMRRLAPLLLLALALATPRRLAIGIRMDGPPAPDLAVVRGIVAPAATLAGLLAPAVSPTVVHGLVEAARPLHDLRRIAEGHPFGFALTPDGVLACFTYGIDELNTLRVSRSGNALQAELVKRSYDRQVATVAGRVDSSLFMAITEGGEEDQLALDLAEIFAWDIDFNTEIQSGDSFRLAVEKLYLEGSFKRYGRILAAEFRRGERTLRAVRFASAAGDGYYDPNGNPLRKAFLKSPLPFGRISSRFTMARLHPILRIVRPHLGVDYAAPTGTPVRAVADGLVTLAGRLGGYGWTVRVRHANSYETLYGHLSRIHVRRGGRVSQGTIVGAVGATGIATGPHLDFRMMRSGRYINPLRAELPPAPPIAAGERAAFALERDRCLNLLPPVSPRAQASSAKPQQQSTPTQVIDRL
jgi:murein DD-endopeptidase MepM/ murein hydrolase activator NlpD